MGDDWACQVRVYFSDAFADMVDSDPANPALAPIFAILAGHDATLKSQFDAFAAYVAEAEANDPGDYPLYRWTKATLDDPQKAAKHRRSFAVRISGAEVYPKPTADALEAALLPLVDGDNITRVSKQDTNPANNLPVPAEYR
jgi:hypothetical protein